MTITISDYSFAGPFTSIASLEDRSGVYAVLTPSDGNNYTVLDVGESSTVKSRVENHDRKDCWQRRANSGKLAYSALYMSGEQQRQATEQKIRQKYDPPCGKR